MKINSDKTKLMHHATPHLCLDVVGHRDACPAGAEDDDGHSRARPDEDSDDKHALLVELRQAVSARVEHSAGVRSKRRLCLIGTNQ